MSVTRIIYRDLATNSDTEEYLTATVTCSTAGVELDAQPVTFSFDREIWYAAEWIGDPAATRSAQLLMTDDNLPEDGSHPLFVRVTDTPEAPIIKAGTLTVR